MARIWILWFLSATPHACPIPRSPLCAQAPVRSRLHPHFPQTDKMEKVLPVEEGCARSSPLPERVAPNAGGTFGSSPQPPDELICFYPASPSVGPDPRSWDARHWIPGAVWRVPCGVLVDPLWNQPSRGEEVAHCPGGGRCGDGPFHGYLTDESPNYQEFRLLNRSSDLRGACALTAGPVAQL